MGITSRDVTRTLQLQMGGVTLNLPEYYQISKVGRCYTPSPLVTTFMVTSIAGPQQALLHYLFFHRF